MHKLEICLFMHRNFELAIFIKLVVKRMPVGNSQYLIIEILGCKY